LTQQDPATRQRPPTSATLETLDYVDTACVRITGTFDEYWASRGKNLRQNIKKQVARLAQDGIEAQLEVVEDPADVAQAIAQYGGLESAGWKAKGGTAIGPDNAQGRFYRSVFESFCSKGLGRIYRFSLDGKIVAMDLCLIGGGALVILKTTYDESLKSISPAFLMRYRYVQSIFAENGIDRIEFYGKVMEWHLRWTDEVRTLFHVNCYRWRWVRALRDKVGTRSTSPPTSQTAVADKVQGDVAT
jgi:CelD/BcsL family acetyltransferase involved in cellulose biosynthesis